MLRSICEYMHILVFYILSFSSIYFSIITINTHKTLRAAVFLCLTMITNACLYLLLGAEFLAIVQILIYVSGIIILLVFVIMLTDTLQEEEIDVAFSKKFIAIIVSCLFFIANLITIFFLTPIKKTFFNDIIAYNENNLIKIGFKLLDLNQNGYILPFEIISVLLLVVLIGCIKISKI